MLLSLLSITAVYAKVVSYSLEVTRGTASPDCYAATVYLINGKFMVF
jgi:hypothetical protein